MVGLVKFRWFDFSVYFNGRLIFYLNDKSLVSGWIFGLDFC